LPGREKLSIAALMLAAALLGPSCSDERAATGAVTEQDAALTEVERGPVKVTVSVVPREPRLSDNPTLTLTVEAEEGVEVEMPPFGQSIGDFLIRGFSRPLPQTRGSRRVTSQVYELEPVRTGEHLIHPITVRFVDGRLSGDGEEHFAETEGLTVTVRSVLGEEVPSLADLKPPQPPMDLPPERFDPLWLLAAVPVAALAAFILWRRTRRRTEAAAPRLLPRELAYLELKDLLAAGFLERGELGLYFTALTGIVRRFIERTTGIRAPEQTTEEFLREVGRLDAFSGDERVRLKDFLEAADLVKFAALRPSGDEIEASFDRAKVFLGLNGDEGTHGREPAAAGGAHAPAGGRERS